MHTSALIDSGGIRVSEALYQWIYNSVALQAFGIEHFEV